MHERTWLKVCLLCPVLCHTLQTAHCMGISETLTTKETTLSYSYKQWLVLNLPTLPPPLFRNTHNSPSPSAIPHDGKRPFHANDMQTKSKQFVNKGEHCSKQQQQQQNLKPSKNSAATHRQSFKSFQDSPLMIKSRVRFGFHNIKINLPHTEHTQLL